MSQVLTNVEIASLVGAAVLKKEEGDIRVHVLSESLAQAEGYTPDRLRAQVYVVTDKELTEVRVGFSGNQGLAFHFKIFSDEATQERVTRYMDHYLTQHKHHLSMMK